MSTTQMLNTTMRNLTLKITPLVDYENTFFHEIKSLCQIEFSRDITLPEQGG
jgi:hypothetical protein